MIAGIAGKLSGTIEKHLLLFRLLVVAIAAIVATVSSLRMIRHPFEHGDFGVYLHAARSMLSGQNVYTTPTRPAEGGLFYIYPPLLAFLFIPLSLLPENISIVLWTVLNVVLIAWVVSAAVKVLSGTRFSALPVRTRWAIGFFSLLLTGRFIQQHLDRGQTNIMEMALLVLGMKLIARGGRRSPFGGVVIGLSVALKIITAPYTIWLGLERQFKTLASAAIGLAIGLLSPALLLGWKANSFLLSFWFHRFALDSARQETTLSLTYNYSIRAVLLRLFTPIVAFERGGHAYRFTIFHASDRWISAADWLLRFAILGVLIVYWLWFRKSSELIFRGGGMALTCAAIPLLFPTTQQNYFVFLLPTVIYTLYWQIGLKLRDPWFHGWIAAYCLLGVITAEGICGRFLRDVSVAVGTVPLAAACLICAVFRVAALEAKGSCTGAQLNLVQPEYHK